MTWYNPFSWFKEDPVTRCGWYALSIYHNPKDDPYYDFCAYDDAATSKGSPQEKDVPLDRYIEAGIAQIRTIQSKFKDDSWEYELGEFYMTIWPHVVSLFWEGTS